MRKHYDWKTQRVKIDPVNLKEDAITRTSELFDEYWDGQISIDEAIVNGIRELREVAEIDEQPNDSSTIDSRP
ncbi:hypothetical protein MOO45_02780 [Bombilactobacillus folatiphilus]|uniref:Antitoxin n=1 Tax=Bombilactobacillus folatiphilus TaxID=2923362 RepID=A0ABY4PAF4_9LACO|nr:hypothetical protein [Bombilactobacillus folatiphilus]UQS82590.1 hypothetical protein MOO45_02780 [Bombilactobacillus folatiphilus]